MAISQDLYGSTYSIPQEGDTNWASDTTSVLQKTANGCDDISGEAGTDVCPKLTKTSLSLAAGATIPSVGGTVSKAMYYVSGSSGAVTLGSVAIANGSFDGQKVVLKGESDSNTVQINHNSNTNQNGNIVLADGDVITFEWDDTGSVWNELNRTT